MGLANRSQLHPREVFRVAVRASCTRIILAHGHPSDDPAPSSQDIAVTRQLAEAGKVLGIELVGHVVLGRKCPSRDKDCVSLREMGEVQPKAKWEP